MEMIIYVDYVVYIVIDVEYVIFFEIYVSYDQISENWIKNREIKNLKNGAFAESPLGDHGRFPKSQRKGSRQRNHQHGQNAQLCREPFPGSRQRLLSLCRELPGTLGKDYFQKKNSLPRALIAALGKVFVSLPTP